jgi:acyl-CoA synthetase (NDP forming)
MTQVTALQRGGEQLGWLRAQALEWLATGRSEIGEAEVREWLSGVVPFGPHGECATPDEAADLAEELGLPTVVKVASDGLLHKSDLGLVRVGLRCRQDVAGAAAELLQRSDALGLHGARLTVQRQIEGVEAAVGIRRDPLGVVCMVAGGGTLIELYRDVALGMAPVDEVEAADMVARLRLAKLLAGYRGAPQADTGALVHLVVTMSRLALAVPEIAELDLNPVLVGAHGCVAVDASGTLAAANPDEPSQQFGDLRFLLEPRGVAIVGASDDGRKVGGLLLKYLRKHDFGGEVVVVHPTKRSIDGVDAVRTLQDAHGPLDLACVAVPADAVEEVVTDCMRSGVPGGVIYSAGFAESGERGRMLQERLVGMTRGRFRFLGPNSMGVAVPSRGYFATFGMALEADILPEGPIGFVSQSGAIASSLFSRSAEFGTGFSHWVSVGNEADLGVEDVVAYLADEDSCKVICLFLEVVRRPKAFANAAAKALRAGKALIALKTGRSEAGRAAAASHTGALSGSDDTYSAFFAQHGVIRVRNLPGLFVAAQGILTAGEAVGTRIGIVSMSGGACSVLADACVAAGLVVPPLDQTTQQRLRSVIPAFGGVRNPVDVTAVGIQRPHMVRDAVAILREAASVDLVLVQLSTNADPAAHQMASDLVGLLDEPGPPVLIGRLGSPALAPKAVQVYQQRGVHVFAWPEQLVEAAVASVSYGRARHRIMEVERWTSV